MARKTSPEEILNTPLPDAAEMLRLQRDAAGQFTGSLHEWSQRITEVNQEIMGFMQKRAETNQAMMESLIECRDAGDLGQLQSDWMQKTMTDYTAEMQRVMELYTRSLLAPLEAVARATGQATETRDPSAQAAKPAKKRSAA